MNETTTCFFRSLDSRPVIIFAVLHADLLAAQQSYVPIKTITRVFRFSVELASVKFLEE
jgi:hypothetical protein